MITLLVKTLIGYAVISLVIAVFTILDWQAKEKELMDVPYGDLEFYDTDAMFRYHGYHFFFFPSIIVIKAWICFCRFVNNRLM